MVRNMLQCTTSPSLSCQLPCALLPRHFARAHKMVNFTRICVVVHSGITKKSWSLPLSHYPSRGETAIISGWGQFVTDNGVAKGDRLVFSLTAMPKFRVYIFDSNGLPKAPLTVQPSSFPTEIKVSHRIHRVLESLRNKREDSTAEGTENLASMSCDTRLKRKAISDDESTDQTVSNAACQSPSHRSARSTKAETVEDSPLKTCAQCSYPFKQDTHVKKEPLSKQEELVKEEILFDREEFVMPFTRTSDRNLNLSQKLKIHAPPKAEHLLQTASFQKQLVKGNLSRMEIPAAFVKKYGSRFQTRVQLQGTLEVSPVRDVGCVCYNSSGQSRFFMLEGWHDFVLDNMLREGQNILFTLTANLVFIVRVVIP
ncbi:hypothetical protein M758_2G161800 [Ceratodon purpureus]|nr:hypothetical protein M758_2G161800 [Ceratodon purpureus]